MQFESQHENTLIVLLTEAIQIAQVHHWERITVSNEWEDKVKSSLEEGFRRKIYRILDNGGMSSLVSDFLMIKFIRHGCAFPEYDRGNFDKKVPLVDYSQFTDSLGIAREIVDYIKTLPFRYICCTPALVHEGDMFPNQFHLKISDRLSLVSTAKVPSNFRTKSSNPRKDEYVRRASFKTKDFMSLKKDSIYFVYNTSGIVSDRVRPACFSDFYDELRAFYGACMAHGIIQFSSMFKWGGSQPVFGNSVREDGWELEIVEPLEEDLKDLTDSFFSNEIRKSIQSGRDINEVFEPVVKLFNSKGFQRLKTSCIWLFRSFHAERGMDKILSSTIAIEVLLGDRDASDRIGLSKLMANRCAYSLGRTAEDRQAIYQFFIEFYKLRSEIVHSGRLNISDDELKVVTEGLSLASRILCHEVAMN